MLVAFSGAAGTSEQCDKWVAKHTIVSPSVPFANLRAAKMYRERSEWR